MSKEEMLKKLKSKKVLIDGHAHIGISPKFYYQYGYPYAMSLEDMIIRMEFLGIDYSVAFPFVDSAFYEIELDATEIKTTKKYCSAPYEIENKNLINEVYEIFPEYGKKILPFFMFDPTRETEKQVANMEMLSDKYPVYGLKTATTYIQAFVNDLETKGKPILDFVKRKNLPMLFHSSVQPADPWASVYDIVDFAERHPDIRVCIAHSARFTTPVLEKADQLENCFVDLSAFIIHCKLVVDNLDSVATEDIRFPGDYTNPLSVMNDLIKKYPDTMIWGSDTPFNYWIQKFYTSDGKLSEDRLECGFKEETQLLNSLPDNLKYKAAYTNVIKFIFG